MHTQRAQKKIVPVMYSRSSSNEAQHRQLNSIPEQRNGGVQWAKWNKTEFVAYFDDKITGGTFDRPSFSKMWRYCRENRGFVTHVICKDVTRFGREGAKYLEWWHKFRAIGIEVNFYTEWFDFDVPETLSRFYARIGDAEAERKRIGIRTCDGKAGLRRMGFFNDQLAPPWSYEPLARIDGRKYAKKNEIPFEAYKIATESYNKMRITQVQARAIAFKKTGYKISKSAFSRWLRTPLPYGFIPVYDDYAKPIADREINEMIECVNVPVMFKDLGQYYTVLERVRQTEPASVGKIRAALNPEFPLVNLMKCPTCNEDVRGYLANPSRKTPTPYYDHLNHFRQNRSEVNSTLRKALNEIKPNPEKSELIKQAAKKALKSRGLDGSKEKEKLTKALNAVIATQNRLEASFMRMDAEVFSNMSVKLAKERQQIEIKIKEMKTAKAAGADMVSQLIKLVDNLGGTLMDSSALIQHQILSAFFPEGFVVDGPTFRTDRINSIVAATCSYPEEYIGGKKKGEPNKSGSPVCGRTRALYRTDEALLKDLFYTLKNVG